MRKVFSFSLAVAICALVSNAQAEELKSGLQKGDRVGAYYVEKTAGNVADGVDVGQNLCYRCKLGAQPVVAVFARSTDAKVVALVKELDKAVTANSKKRLASFVNLLGDDQDSLKSQSVELIKQSKAENIAVVVPNDFSGGPAILKLNPKAEVTVLLWSKGKVQANHAIQAKDLSSAKIKAIVADAGKMLK